MGSVIIGNPDADIVLTEYASLTCPHCKDFHEDVLSRIKTDYIATGKVRFVFQEFPTPPVELALAGFALARCAGEEGYLDVMDDFFSAQNDIFNAARSGTIGEELIALGERHGTSEADFEACVTNAEHRRAVAASVERGTSQGINSTPSVLLNGEELNTPASRTADGLAALIEAKLANETTGSDAAETSEPASGS